MRHRHAAWLLAWGAFLAGQTSEKPYFQQHVSYQIRVALDPGKALLHGHLRLTYENRSPDTLPGLYIHLWPNAYKNRHTPYAIQQRRNGKSTFHFAQAAQRGYMDSLSFSVNGVATQPLPVTKGPRPAPGYSQYLLKKAIDVVWLPFPEPLPPGGKVVIETPFRVKIPNTFSRLGHAGQQFQITQWYPKPAVYDRKGWHPLPYLDMGEFYSEWGRYEVEITVPSTYVVGATGVLQTDSEIAWLQQREAETRRWLMENGPAPAWDTSSTAPPKTLRFIQDSVHDFAWFADPRYAVLSDTVTLPNGHRVACVALFRPACAKSWKNAPRYIVEAVTNLSAWVGPYPYAHATAVEGALGAGGGMEYPMITVIGGCQMDTSSLRTVIHHEVGHNWFQGLLGSNERRHPWQDEGINTYYEQRLGGQNPNQPLIDTTGKTSRLKIALSGFFSGAVPLGKLSYLMPSNPLSPALYHWNLDQPLSLSSEFYSTINYGLGVYQRTGELLWALEASAGEAQFDRGMQRYFQTCAFRHPYPEDWVAALRQEGIPAECFLKALYSDREPDFRLRVRPVGAGRYAIRVEEPHGYWQDLRLEARLISKTGRLVGSHFLAVGATDTLTLPPETHLIALNPQQALFERRVGNNFYFTRGVFRTYQRPRFHLGPATLPALSRTDIGLTPLFGYNFRDGLLAGLLINHGLFPKRLLEFHLLPMYSILRGTLRGSAGVTLRAFPVEPWYLIELRGRVMAFSGLLRTKVSVEAHKRAPQDRFGWHETWRLRTYQLAFEDENGTYQWENQARPAYTALDWEVRREEAILTWYSFMSGGVDWRGHFRLEIEGQLFWRAFSKWALWARAYAGYLSGSAAPYLYLRPSGYDPFGEEVLIDRFRLSAPRFVSRQIPENQGGMRLPTDTLLTRRLLTANVELPMPNISFIRLRGDMGYLPESRRELVSLSLGLTTIRWRHRFVMGIYFPLWGDAFGPARSPGSLRNILNHAVWHIRIPLDVRGAPVGLF